MELGSEEKAKKASFKIVCLMMRECELDPLAPMSTTLEYGGSTRSELREFRGCGLSSRFGIDRHYRLCPARYVRVVVVSYVCSRCGLAEFHA